MIYVQNYTNTVREAFPVLVGYQLNPVHAKVLGRHSCNSSEKYSMIGHKVNQSYISRCCSHLNRLANNEDKSYSL